MWSNFWFSKGWFKTWLPSLELWWIFKLVRARFITCSILPFKNFGWLPRRRAINIFLNFYDYGEQLLWNFIFLILRFVNPFQNHELQWIYEKVEEKGIDILTFLPIMFASFFLSLSMSLLNGGSSKQLSLPNDFTGVNSRKARIQKRRARSFSKIVWTRCCGSELFRRENCKHYNIIDKNYI